jgi:hypothetical protein
LRSAVRDGHERRATHRARRVHASVEAAAQVVQPPDDPLPMTFDQLGAFLPVFGTWLSAGLLTGWLFGLLQSSARGR